MHSNSEAAIKLDQLKKYLPLLAACPYTRLILLAGSTAAGNPQPHSDIDLIVVSRHNRVWLNRFFWEALTRTLKIRRTKNNFENRICFNMFLSNDHPLLPHRDAAAASCYKNLKPLWGGGEDIKNFWRTNSWLENFEKLPRDSFNTIYKKYPRPAKAAAEKILDYSGWAWLMEKICYTAQSRYIIKKINQAVADKKSPDFDFNLTPNVIAYHFPVSNHALALKKLKKTGDFPAAVDNTTPKRL